VGRYHASRTVVPRRPTAGASTSTPVATIASDVHPEPGQFALLRETVARSTSASAISRADTIVDPLWCPTC
jgi:hypothetical protein